MSPSLHLEQSVYPQQSVGTGHILLFLWQKKWRVLFLAALMTTAAGFMILKLPKIYTASSTLLLGSADKGLALPSLSLPGVGGNELDTYIEFIRSRAFARILVDQLVLGTRPEYAPLAGESEIVRQFQQNLAISQVKNTDMLKVSFSSTSAETAQEVADSIGPTFFSFHGKLQQQKVLNRSEHLNQQMQEIQARLGKAESDYQQYLDSNNIADLQAQMSMTQSQISELVREQLQQEKRLSEARINLQQARKVRGNHDALMSQAWIMQSPLVMEARRQWVSQSEQMERIKSRYKYKHPKFIQASVNLSSADQELKKRIEEQFSNMQQTILAGEQRSRELASEIDRNKAEFRQLGEHQTVLTRLGQELTATKKVHEVFMAKLQEMEMLKDMGQSKEFAVVDTASLPTEPSKPNVAGLFVMAASFSILFSGGFWFILSLIGDQFTRLNHVLKLMEVSVLAMLPKIQQKHKKRQARPLRSGLGEANYLYAEGIRSLRTAVMVGQHGTQSGIVAVTSIKPGQGKASVVSNLADSISNIESVLLADIDMRQPSLAKAYGLDEKKPGLTEFFDGKAKLSLCMFQRNNGRLTLLPSGSIPSDPLALISTARFREFLQRLRSKFPRILLEAPPVNSVSDALVLSRLVDGVIVVCDVESTQPNELSDIIQHLREANVPLLGVVLNRVKSNMLALKR
ncbi:GumC family protein [Bowmanella dokdonensis]|uniref:Polysaccharide biosynthesis tyrosine autokinase n=1 Tax=Bowmanella dokdonensis TaxID=751969 RepID=A0A939IQI7_9ALTE|nr:polysaccharide biosynthesis tyrosine autokinase [Bowmanella dokdonensis]MBN7825074.1 polysaccharide biosynthesis tyrosine autokinase [Bowmanella dokdonensis]